MPTYEFRCEAGHSFDRFLKMSEAPLELACAQCGKPASRQMSGGAGLVFKGSGFYLTDYGRAGQKPPAAEGSTATTDSKAADSKAADSKASKGESAPAAAPTTTTAKSDKSGSTKTSTPSE